MSVPIAALVFLVLMLTAVIRTTRHRDEPTLSRDAEDALRKLDREHRLLRERARLSP